MPRYLWELDIDQLVGAAKEIDAKVPIRPKIRDKADYIDNPRAPGVKREIVEEMKQLLYKNNILDRDGVSPESMAVYQSCRDVDIDSLEYKVEEHQAEEQLPTEQKHTPFQDPPEQFSPDEQSTERRSVLDREQKEIQTPLETVPEQSLPEQTKELLPEQEKFIQEEKLPSIPQGGVWNKISWHFHALGDLFLEAQSSLASVEPDVMTVEEAKETYTPTKTKTEEIAEYLAPLVQTGKYSRAELRKAATDEFYGKIAPTTVGAVLAHGFTDAARNKFPFVLETDPETKHIVFSTRQPRGGKSNG